MLLVAYIVVSLEWSSLKRGPGAATYGSMTAARRVVIRTPDGSDLGQAQSELRAGSGSKYRFKSRLDGVVEYVGALPPR
jgi:hypothetical protein